MERTHWYRDRVFYQIWPRSFKDGNGDGMGDLYGVLDKLDYIKSLGIGGIWFSPLYVSPGVDCGYDIADYYHIAPEFGGDEAFDAVLKAAHERDIKVIMDLVVNHTSTECEWFQKSRQRIEPYTDYYIWRPAGKNGKHQRQEECQERSQRHRRQSCESHIQGRRLQERLDQFDRDLCFGIHR